MSEAALVIEDNTLIAMDIADMLEGMGFARVDIAATVSDALARLEGADYRVALLDINLGAETSEPVAESLAGAGIPFVLASGDQKPGPIHHGFPNAPRLGKPFSQAQLEEAVRACQAE